MWLYLLNDHKTGHCSLFYKGNGVDPHRTPSAWISENNLITIQVSTSNASFVGTDSHLWYA
jgi:hypothetical protein